MARNNHFLDVTKKVKAIEYIHKERMMFFKKRNHIIELEAVNVLLAKMLSIAIEELVCEGDIVSSTAFAEKQEWLRQMASGEETPKCHCCKEEIPNTKEHYDNYGGLCDFCYPGVPADYDPDELETNGCDCCRAGRQY